MQRPLAPLLTVPALVLAMACNEPVTTYGSAQKAETVNADFSVTDVQMIAEAMVASLLATDKLQPDPAEPGQPPLITVDRIANNTSEHIDTKAISDKIRISLIKSGKVRFSAASEAMGALQAQYQQQAVFADTATAKAAGHHEGAKYLLKGRLFSTVKHQGRVRDVAYTLNLEVLDVETGVIAWAEEKEIRKETVRKLIAF